MSIKKCYAIRKIAVHLKPNATFTLDGEYKPMIFDTKKKISALIGCRLFSYSVLFSNAKQLFYREKLRKYP